MHNTKLGMIALSLFLVLILASCGSTTPTATPTPVPPTETAEPPTATAVPPTAAPEGPTRMLFIGDSFSMGYNQFMEAFVTVNDPDFAYESEEIARGGTSLYGHWFAPRTVPTIQDGNWTYVILQEDLAIEGLDVDNFYEYARLFDAEIKDSGAETILYMPWEYDTDNPMRIEEIARVFGEVGTELGVKVAPVGLAWTRSIAERPDLDLYDGDRTHSGDAGAYLSIAVIYATIFDQDPAGIFLEQTGLSQDDMAFLQRIAWETVVDYQQ